ncbi:MAG: nucleoside triphosphate pyrophosphatase [Alphaproteobacteria bacterium]
MISNKKIILASTSERRINLLKQLGVSNFEVVKPNFDEDKYKYEYNHSVSKKVVNFSYFKANSILNETKQKDKIIISGDTEVFRSGKVLSKCKSKEQVKDYLLYLSGKKHYVFGGICVINFNGIVLKKLVKTEVYFDKIPKDEIHNDVLLNEGLGKAGGYAIQGIAGKFVRKIRGSYTNVVGLSTNHLYKILIGIGFKN